MSRLVLISFTLHLIRFSALPARPLPVNRGKPNGATTYNCSAGRLIRGNVLLRFVECLVEIEVFLIGQGKAYPELEEENWLVKLMFLMDITMHLNKLHLCLHGPGKTVIGLLETWKGFVAKLDVYTRDIQTATFCYFKHLKAFSVDHQVNGAEININMRDSTSQFRN